MTITNFISQNQGTFACHHLCLQRERNSTTNQVLKNKKPTERALNLHGFHVYTIN